MGGLTERIYEMAVELEPRWPDDDLWKMVPTVSEVEESLELAEVEELLPGEE